MSVKFNVETNKGIILLHADPWDSVQQLKQQVAYVSSVSEDSFILETSNGKIIDDNMQRLVAYGFVHDQFLLRIKLIEIPN